ncbi:MAG: peptidoglycan-associated lipoprotein Pal [Thermodesulfobacteriota bacterium]
MKKTILNSSLCLILAGAFTIFISGCGKKTVTPPDTGATGGTSIDYPPADAYSEESLPAEGTLDDSSGQRLGSMSISGERSEEQKRMFGRSSMELKPIYFAFDQASIRGDMADNMLHNGNYMMENPSVSVVIEGNCDERGTNEYNLALGERRAINAKEYLVDLGVRASRIRTVSYGEERPLFMGQDEDSMMKNRRDDFILE